MYVMTMKFSKKKAVIILIALAIILAAIVIIAGTAGNGSEGTGKVKTNEARVSYLSQLGWQVEPECLEEQAIVIPREFSDIFNEYNKLQQQQGFDLAEYKGLEVQRYTYRVTNYPNTTDEVEAELYVRNGIVIGGDIHSTALDGFIHGLK